MSGVLSQKQVFTQIMGEALPQLRVLRYKQTTTFIFKTCHNYKEIREKLGNFPYLSVATAKSMVIKRMQQLQLNTYEYNKSMTLQQVIDTVYLPDLHLNKRNTQSEFSKLNRYVIPKFGTFKLSQITHPVLAQYCLELRATLAPATVNRIISIFKKIFSLCIEQGLLVRSPAQALKSVQENNHRRVVLSESESIRFKNACLSNGGIGAFALYLSLVTGMRIGEVIRIRVEEINFTDKTILLPTTKNNLPHIVPFTDEIAQAIKAHIEKHQCTTFLFPSNRSGQTHIATPRYAFNQVCQSLGITGLVIHDLRRTFATSMLERTNDLNFVNQLLNHKTLSTTQRYAFYSKQAMLKQYSNVMNAVQVLQTDAPSFSQ